MSVVARRRIELGAWVVVVTHVATFAALPIYISFGTGNDPKEGSPFVILPLAAAMFALQLRHSLAAARGERPRYWPLTLAALVLLTYVPLRWMSWGWGLMFMYITPSLTTLLPRRLGVGLSLTMAFGYDVALLIWAFPVAYYYILETTIDAFLAWLALFGSSYLVRLLGELRAARSDLAELSVGRERLRVSRDLHDLLGQSLSAISLKGSLAIRLLGRDPEAARAEIASLTGVARDALRGVRAVTRDEHAPSLPAEADGAAALLASAGIELRIDIDLPGLGSDAERVLAWAVREGVANVVRHSRATSCSIVAGCRDGSIVLEVVNDGAVGPVGTGSGLTGVAERARARSGSASAGPLGEDRFRLRVTLPEGAA